jgi:hypothetical protein
MKGWITRWTRALFLSITVRPFEGKLTFLDLYRSSTMCDVKVRMRDPAGVVKSLLNILDPLRYQSLVRITRPLNPFVKIGNGIVRVN